MKKNIRILSLLFAAVLLSACGSGNNAASTAAPETTAAAPETTTAAPETVSMYDLSKAMCAADPSLPEMSRVSSSDEAAADLFTYFSKLDYGSVDAYFLTYAAKGPAEEIGVIALKDAKDAAECKKTLEAHLQDRINLYKTYAPEQVARAEKAMIVTEGRYVALIMCGDQQAVTEVFKSFLEG